ncbi:MAG: hypothetical protein U1E45_22315 [Geminicoccaceae bacterium]
MRRLEHVVRDGLRGARFMVRHLAAEHQHEAGSVSAHERDWPGDVLRLIPGVQVLKPVAKLADRVVAGIEGVEHSVGTVLGGRPLVLRGIADYARLGARQFTVEMYRICRQRLAAAGAQNVFVSEQVFAEIHREVFEGWTATQDKDRILAACCELALAIVAERPVLDVDQAVPSDRLRNPNLYLGLVIGLATAVRSEAPTDSWTSAEDVLHHVDLVVDARFERLERAVGEQRPEAALSREFGSLVGVLV